VNFPESEARLNSQAALANLSCPKVDDAGCQEVDGPFGRLIDISGASFDWLSYTMSTESWNRTTVLGGN